MQKSQMQLQDEIPTTQQAYDFDPEILREYDIRGQIGKNLSVHDAFAIGCSFGTYVRNLGGSRVCVGYDGRESSPIFEEALVNGLLSTGLEVERVGLGPSPMLYFAVKDHMADGGVMITGSHNPPDYNGFKMMLQNGPVYGKEIKELGNIAANGNFAQGKGSVRDIDVKEDYVNRLLRDFNAPESNPLNVVWDCGNGASGEIVRMLTARLPGKHYLLYDEIDGNFPNHHPDPTVDENLEDLIQSVIKNNCDLGVAFDGDGDRIGAVDERGNVFRCDTLIAIYAKDILEEHKGAPIIGDVKCSQIMYDEIARLGGQPVMWKTGHSLIKAKMVELKAPLAGELSGHIFFADKYYGFDDGIYCAIRLMNEVADHDGPASDLITHLPTIYNTPEIRFEVDERQKFDLVNQVLESVRSINNDSYQVNDIDGLRVTTPDGWWLLRASNTQNVLVTRAESNTQDGLQRIINMIKNEVEKIGYGISFE